MIDKIKFAAIAGAVILGVWALCHLSWKFSEDVVSGIVYDAHFDDWPAHNTTFKVRAAAEMAMSLRTQARHIACQAAANTRAQYVMQLRTKTSKLSSGLSRCHYTFEREYSNAKATLKSPRKLGKNERTRNNHNSSRAFQWCKKKLVGQLDIVGRTSSRDVAKQ